ncbi:Intraflagellar transport protein 57 [Desmophyllum pertusum]|uniref:Intraflagellar transport protein 57 n=1 Tax=Desmophyllum pertusum TaxID=174260 RepID=A0A9W9YBK3_9CNID|nr:Intraflagellar transport protein 57 [Desmophyllum pertusum]
MEGEVRRGGDAAADNASMGYMLTVVTMEEVLEKLKLLDYETDFCKQMGFRPLSRHYFAMATNPGEQFFTFTSLSAWLLTCCGRSFEQPQEYDDPNATVSNILDELKKLGVVADFPPAKLKTGSGEQVCYVIDKLADEALKVKNFVWQKPQHEQEDFEEETMEDDEAELTLNKVEEEMKDIADSSKPDSVMESTIDAAEWKLEVERVLPLLKVHIRTDNKDWRTHYEQMQQHSEGIKSSLTETKGHLDKLHHEISRTLEKISSREKYINNQLEHLLQEFRSLQDSLAETKERYKQGSGGVTELTKSLSQITEELESVKAQMDERGTNMTDAGPLVRIKQALTRLKQEVQQMEVRIGVVEHSLLVAKIRDRSAIREDMHAPVSDAATFGDFKPF